MNKDESQYTCLECESKNVKYQEITSTKEYLITKTKLILTCQNCGSLNVRRHCPECKSLHIIQDDIRATIDCNKCGLVLSGQPPFLSGYWKVEYPWGNYLEFQDDRYSNRLTKIIAKE